MKRQPRADPVDLHRRAQAALQSGDGTSAIIHAQAASDAFEAAGQFSNGLLCQLLVSRGRAMIGDIEAAQTVLDQVVASAERRGLPLRKLAALTDLGVLAEARGDVREAVALHRQVLDAQRELGNSVGIAIAAANVARLLPRLALADHREAAAEQAFALLQEAGQRFAAADQTAQATQVLVVLGDQLRTAGQLQRARLALQDAAQAATRGGDPATLAAATLNLAYVQRDLGDVAAARTAFADALRYAVRAGDPIGRLRALLGAAIEGSDGWPAQRAEAEFARLDKAFEAAGQSAAGLAARANQASALARLGRLQQASVQLQAVHRAQLDAGERLAATEVLLALAELAIARCDEPAFCQCASELAAQLGPDPHGVAHPSGGRLHQRWLLVQARRQLRAKHEQSVLALLEAAAEGEPTRATQRVIALGRARLALWQGDTGCVERLRRMLDESHDCARDQAGVQLALAEASALLGHVDAAKHHAAQAVMQWRTLQEPAPLAQALSLQVWLGEPIDAAELQSLADCLMQQACLDTAWTARAALATLAGDDAAWQAAVAELVRIGAGATSWTVTKMSNLSRKACV